MTVPRKPTAALVRRTATVLGVTLGVMTSFVAGFAVASARTEASSHPVRLTGQDLGTGRSCDGLLQWYVDHAVTRVTAWGWDNPMMYDGVALPAAGAQSGSTPDKATAPLDTATGSETGTNVQEAGVDEPDAVKLSGTVLYRVVDDTVTTYDVSGRRPHELGSVPLLGMSGAQLLVAGDRLVALGEAPVSPTAGAYNGPTPAATWVRTFDVSDPARPVEVDSRRYDGALVTARQTGGVVRVVLSDSLPDLPFVTPDDTRTTDQALAANQAVVRTSSIGDWLPTVSVGGSAAHPVVPCADVAVPDAFGGLGTLTVVGLDPSAPQSATATAVATDSTLAYVSPTHLYVATAPDPLPWGCCREVTPQADTPVAPQAEPRFTPPTTSTRLYAFDLTGTSATYVGAGSVDGRIADSWSMDEYDGVLRVAVGSVGGATTNSVVLLRPGSGRLTEVGRLDGLGVDQQIRSMRWFDGLAVMVTFEQVDPLYVLDLADPTHPQVRGALHLPGWSSYLHPVGDHLVLGLGQTSPNRTQVDVPPTPMPTPMPTTSSSPKAGGTASGGTPPVSPFPVERAKATLFDIGDLAHPRALGTVRYPAGSIAGAGVDPHQVTWLPERHTLLTVVSQGYAGPQTWISVLRVRHGSLHDHLIPVDSSAGPAGVRTVPLADGRVLLVTPTTVRFLSV